MLKKYLQTILERQISTHEGQLSTLRSGNINYSHKKTMSIIKVHMKIVNDLKDDIGKMLMMSDDELEKYSFKLIKN